MWKSSIIFIISVMEVSGFTVDTSGVLISPVVTRASSDLSLTARRISSSVMMPKIVPSSSLIQEATESARDLKLVTYIPKEGY